MGWHHQMATSLLGNVSLSIEKLIFSAAKNLEVVMGGEVNAGTMYNGVTLQPIIRIGKMMPYFSDYLNRFTSDGKFQTYFIVKPQAVLVFHNTLPEHATLIGRFKKIKTMTNYNKQVAIRSASEDASCYPRYEYNRGPSSCCL